MLSRVLHPQAHVNGGVNQKKKSTENGRADGRSKNLNFPIRSIPAPAPAKKKINKQHADHMKASIQAMLYIPFAIGLKQRVAAGGGSVYSKSAQST